MHTCLYEPGKLWKAGGIARSGVWFQGLNTDTENSHTSQSGHETDVPPRLHHLVDGGTFIDKRPVDNPTLVRLVSNGPMLRVELPPGTVDRFNRTETMKDMLPFLGGSWKHLAARALADEGWAGFDCLSLDLYAKLWHEHGARIGVRKGDEMHWSDDVIEEIPACTCWLRVCLGCKKLRYYVDRKPGGLFAEARVPDGPNDHCPECKRKGRGPAVEASP